MTNIVRVQMVRWPNAACRHETQNSGALASTDLPTAVGELTPVYLKSDGKISVPFYMLKKSPAFKDEQARRKLLQTFEQPGFRSLRSNIDGEPSFPAPRLISDQSWQQLVEIIMYIIEELRGPDATAANKKEVPVLTVRS
jgi:hypothetical protein